MESKNIENMVFDGNTHDQLRTRIIYEFKNITKISWSFFK